MFSKLSMLAMAGAATVTALAAAAAQAQPDLPQLPSAPSVPGLSQNNTQTCAFREGPRAGQTVDYAGSPGAASVPIGSRCADMQGSSGEAVKQYTARQQSQGRYYSSPGAPNAWSSSGALKPGFTRTCRFGSGPLAGTTKDYSHTLGAQPVAIGAACSDGTSRGVAVAGK